MVNSGVKSRFQVPIKTALTPKNIRSLVQTLIWGTLSVIIIMAIYLMIDGLTNRFGYADLAVVPGTTVKKDGTPSASLQARLDKAIEVYQAGWVKNILVSGGVDKKGMDEAVAMKRYLVEAGIPAGVIWVDSMGNNTYLTTQHSAILMNEQGWGSALAISQYYHVPRTRLALQRFGINPVYAVRADGFSWRGITFLAREVIAYPSYWLRSYLLPES
ncbi:MAG: YdcF family protein [Chloroflexi bacterium HGW-Chloroflexi-10]|nr:MAG: YdcF family protein [Chloroflexi bacterium HGW-Chloroflexi-10]